MHSPMHADQTNRLVGSGTTVGLLKIITLSNCTWVDCPSTDPFSKKSKVKIWGVRVEIFNLIVLTPLRASKSDITKFESKNSLTPSLSIR